MRVAVCQFARDRRSVPLEEVGKAMRSAAAAGAGLLVLPELALNGALAGHELGRMAQPSDGPAAEALADLAAATHIAVLAGHAETCTGKIYSSLMLVDGSGHALANYRRSHLRDQETIDIARGQWLTGCGLGDWTVGVLGGYDLMFPEVARGLVLAGADLLLVGAGPEDDGTALAALATARALENGVAVAMAGWRGPGGAGPARIIAGDGTVLAAVASDGDLVTADIEAGLGPPGALIDRRPKLYQRLVLIEGADAQPPQAA